MGDVLVFQAAQPAKENFARVSSLGTPQVPGCPSRVRFGGSRCLGFKTCPLKAFSAAAAPAHEIRDLPETLNKATALFADLGLGDPTPAEASTP